MKDDKFLEDVFTELSVIKEKLENFAIRSDIEPSEYGGVFIELLDKRSWEIAGIAGEIEQRIIKRKS